MAEETHVLDRPPAGAAADWTIPQAWDRYTAEEHATWDTLYARQSKLLPGRASAAYLTGTDSPLPMIKAPKRGLCLCESSAQAPVSLWYFSINCSGVST